MANGILKQLNQSLESTQHKDHTGLNDFTPQVVTASELLITPAADDVCDNHPTIKPINNAPE